MRAQRIKTGFHRIGIVLASISIAVGLASGLSTSGKLVDYLGVAACYAVALYALAFGLGWIVAGFTGDRDKSLN